MKKEILWSLRLGFSSRQATDIQALGIGKFLEKSFAYQTPDREPDFLENTPKSFGELAAYRQKVQAGNEETEKMVKELFQVMFDMKAWWVERMWATPYPFREKMTCFWHNHFVSTFQAVKVPYWIYQHYSTIYQNAFGNFRTLTRNMMYTNAMIRYLDNNQNKKNNINENLARELLELFTLGEGNYAEEDIKNIARSLAGLMIGEKRAAYRPFQKDNTTKTVFGKSGNFIIDDVVNIIFEQENAPYFITEKILKWFITDSPTPEMIREYGAKLKGYDFEIQPFMQYLLSNEYEKDTAGTKIKDPLLFALQLLHELGINNPNFRLVAFFVSQQGMNLYDQPNVKGWQGGRDWLTSQIYLNRNQFVDFLTSENRKMFQKGLARQIEKFAIGNLEHKPKLNISPKASAKEIIGEYTDKMLFAVDDDLRDDMNKLLKYDFDARAENAQESVLRLLNYIAKTPEFQLL